MSDIAIRVENVSKKFATRMRYVMMYGAMDIAASFFGVHLRTDQLRKGEFLAVNDVSFEVKKGEVVGLIGANGAGKSTMLKMLNGIYMPDKGCIEMHGRVGALIEVGAGFNPMLTGRENIYINGAILGLRKKEIDSKLDSIIDFAGLEEFIDMPVKHYSSGMYVRLGFAIAAQINPDVLLIDEVLAVGDVGFRAKCYDYVSEISHNAAVIFVSHSMPQIARICDRVIVMDHGSVIYDGNTGGGLDQYRSLFPEETSVIHGENAEIASLKLNGKHDECLEIEYGQDLHVEFNVSVNTRYSEFIISLDLLSQDLQLVAQCCSQYNKIVLLNNFKSHNMIITIPNLLLNPGKYYLSIVIYDNTKRKHLAWHHSVKTIKVTSDYFVGSAPFQLQGKWQNK